jgi:hypothetical protein
VSKKLNTVTVDIEVEHNNEYTSEEELEDVNSQYESSNVLGKSSIGSGSQQGSSRDLSGYSKKRDKDYMASFNKKMTSKLRDRIIQT